MFQNGIMILLLLTVSRAVLIDGADVIFHGGIHRGGDAAALLFSTQLVSEVLTDPRRLLISLSSPSLLIQISHSSFSDLIEALPHNLQEVLQSYCLAVTGMSNRVFKPVLLPPPPSLPPGFNVFDTSLYVLLPV